MYIAIDVATGEVLGMFWTPGLAEYTLDDLEPVYDYFLVKVVVEEVEN